MKPTTIFLDLDDVLNTFTLSALKEVGCPIGDFDYNKYNPEWGFDIVSAANDLHPNCEFTTEEFWGLLDENFWATVPQSYECGWLIDLCATLVGHENVCILTADPEKVGSKVASAKVEWIHTFLPKWLREQRLIGTPKWFCARPDALLIDDTDRNTDAFCRAGGQAILFPRPWNSLHSYAPEMCLIQRLDGLFGPFMWKPVDIMWKSVDRAA